MSILILEDEPFISLDIETVLEESGHRNFISYSTCAAGLAWLQKDDPTLAIIDPRLSDGICSSVARHLVSHGIPFIVYSGETQALAEIEPAFGQGDLLMKPAAPDQLIRAVENKLEQGRLAN